MENIWIVATATILNPRFQTLAFGNQATAQEADAKVRAERAGFIRAEQTAQ